MPKCFIFLIKLVEWGYSSEVEFKKKDPSNTVVPIIRSHFVHRQKKCAEVGKLRFY